MPVQHVVTQFRSLVGSMANPGEVKLFRALLKALTSTPQVQAEEYHGNRRQVWHDTAGTVGLGDKRCELADLMLLSFDLRSRVPPRLTFLQAKYERGQWNGVPKGDFVQWSLLARRPQIEGWGGFSPPADLLSGALLRSVGTFGFFTGSGTSTEFVYASADWLVPTVGVPTGKKYGRLAMLPSASNGIARILRRQSSTGPIEAIVAASLTAFLEELLLLHIGTPVEPDWSGTPWLARELRGLGGPLAARAFRQVVEFGSVGQHALIAGDQRGGGEEAGGAGGTGGGPTKTLLVLGAEPDI